MMASILWWVVLAVCWFIVSALKWSHEAVSKLSPYFHFTAWALPLLMTICLLAARVLAANELTAACFIVSNDTTLSFLGLLIGVILPLVVFLLVGIVFLLLGFISILRVRSYMQRGGKREESEILEKLMVRLGVFVAVYIVPASIVIGCFIYELVSRPSWVPLSVSCVECTRANSAVFMVRIFMFLLIGALTGMWIWSRKTVSSWRQFFEKVRRCCRTPVDRELPAPTAENVLSQQMSTKMASYSYPDSGLDSIEDI